MVAYALRAGSHQEIFEADFYCNPVELRSILGLGAQPAGGAPLVCQLAQGPVLGSARCELPAHSR